MSFHIVTWNVLATAYLGRGDYYSVPPEVLDPDWRIPALVRHAADLDADVLCLQEVEADVFAALQTGLEPEGYACLCEFKGRGKPDACATFFRTGTFALRQAVRVEYHDDENGPGRHSGFIALLAALKCGTRLLGVANTHLRWDRPGTAKERQVGYRQAAELIEACRRFAPPCDAWVVCGDFNRGPTSEVVATFRQAGFAFAHAGRPHVRSAVANHKASLIDYLFHTEKLAARPIDPLVVSDRTLLPSKELPSDHLPLAAEFEWVEETEEQ
jgi:mRNA deadenylase 3'-5' endonuclease subunit Ccr4